MNTESQNKEILKYLQRGNKLTQLQALNMFGCLRLGARSFDLRKAGHNIHTEMITVGEHKKRVAEYSYIHPQPKQASIF